jgi:type IV pilus assembly protein PilA
MNASPGQAPPQKPGMPTWIIVAAAVGGFAFLIMPIFGVLAIYGVRKYLANAKTAEARNVLGELARDAATAYERDHALCPSASRAVPVSVATVKGQKYQSAAADWQIDRARKAGFACLGFAIDTPQYYQYEYAVSRDKPGEFMAAAHGDLNGDGKISTLIVRGKVVGGTVVIAPQIEETDPEE